MFFKLIICFVYFCLTRFFPRQSFFIPPPPWFLSLTFQVPSFLLSFHLPDLLQPACFSACFSLLRVAPALRTPREGCQLSVRVELKGLCDFQSTPREGRKVSNHKPSAPCTERKDKHLDQSLCCLLYPYFPRCGRNHKHNDLSALFVW